MKRNIRLVVSRQKFVNGASDAAMACSDERGRLQKAAAWQWFMHSAGSEAQLAHAKVSAHNVMTGSGAHLQKEGSRFATEAVAGASHASLADDLAEFSHQRRLHIQGEEVGDSFRTGRAHVEKMMPSIADDNRVQKRHLHLLDFPKLLHKLVMSSSNKKRFCFAPPITLDEEEAQHQYHHHIHHHHHHYYHGGDDSGDELEVIKQRRLGYTEHARRRRPSKRGSNQQPYQQEFYHDNEMGEGEEEEEEDDNCKVKAGVCRAISRHSEDFSKQDLQRPIKDFTSGEEIVVGQQLNKCPSQAFARRHNSERLTTMMLTNGNQDMHRCFIRGGSERRPCAEGTHHTFKESRDHCTESGQRFIISPKRDGSPNVAVGTVTPMDVPRPRRHSTSCTASKQQLRVSQHHTEQHYIYTSPIDGLA